ncbi:unnamed protein product [Haemonchus placei]|uniref:Transmembrane protein n=1 Tax=Haemonchus placei TaxID=6290 RepID=A0A0N4XB05_HAEPC|nr:unnamed protein product [Haemonchus placei]
MTASQNVWANVFVERIYQVNVRFDYTRVFLVRSLPNCVIVLLETILSQVLSRKECFILKCRCIPWIPARWAVAAMTVYRFCIMCFIFFNGPVKAAQIPVHQATTAAVLESHCGDVNQVLLLG